MSEKQSFNPSGNSIEDIFNMFFGEGFFARSADKDLPYSESAYKREEVAQARRRDRCGRKAGRMVVWARIGALEFEKDGCGFQRYGRYYVRLLERLSLDKRATLERVALGGLQDFTASRENGTRRKKTPTAALKDTHRGAPIRKPLCSWDR